MAQCDNLLEIRNSKNFTVKYIFTEIVSRSGKNSTKYDQKNPTQQTNRNIVHVHLRLQYTHNKRVN